MAAEFCPGKDPSIFLINNFAMILREPPLPEPPENLDLTSDDLTLDTVSIHIQENLEDALVQEALKTGVDLRQYSKQVELELQQIEHVSIKDYIEQSQNIASLHTQIIACDAILEVRVSTVTALLGWAIMLGGFQSDLSSISSEIQSLQEMSLAMNIKLKNRQTVRSELSELVDELIIPNTMISVILDVPVTEQQFVEQLQELNNKINYVKEQAFSDTQACGDAVAKVREFILQKIYSFRKPMTNYQIPQNALLKYRFFYQFLLGNERSVAQEIQDEYMETMSKVYLSYFKSYTSRLMKVQYEEVAEKDDLMGIEDTAKKDILVPVPGPVPPGVTHLGPHVSCRRAALPNSINVRPQRHWDVGREDRRHETPALRNKNTVFTVGNRAAIINPTELEGPIIVPHTAQRGDVRSALRPPGQQLPGIPLPLGLLLVSGVAALELFNTVMGRSLSMFLKHIDSYVSDCYDSIAIFLCIHIVLRFKGIAQRRDIPAIDNSQAELCVTKITEDKQTPCSLICSVLIEVNGALVMVDFLGLPSIIVLTHDRYWDALLDMLWPRFQYILELNIQMITRRYAEFSSAIVSINQTFPNEKTNVLSGALQVEVENFVLRMAAE
ncbi:unnamed protein product [Ranitomeya imitator]|uniref:Vacuolar protein sorting-associated protein 52 homolog n=1 Tax=Ranitomeya imitator TaxID=111125 RepID=A0ABN9LRY0_9NEOB|nr:unnamed protein product [Ranitomeya imitator]